MASNTLSNILEIIGLQGVDLQLSGEKQSPHLSFTISTIIPDPKALGSLHTNDLL